MRTRDRQHVLRLLHDDDAADDLSGAVEVGGAAPQVVAHLQVADVLQLHRRARRIAPEHEVLQLIEVGAADARRAAGTRGWSSRSCGRRLPGTRRCSVPTTCRSDDARCCASSGGNSFTWYCFSRPPTDATSAMPGTVCKRRLDLPLVDQAQLAQIVQPLAIDERVLVDPTHAAGVGTERHHRVGRQLRPDGVDRDRSRAAGRARGRRRRRG